MISRAGSNAIFEFLALKLPMLLIPLTRKQSRGDQILNAKSFQEKGYAVMLEEEDLTPESLLRQLEQIERKREELATSVEASSTEGALQKLVNEINKV